jgi:Domain of unknown function DUF11
LSQLRRLASVASAALLALTLLGVGTASAATPTWSSTATSIPGSVTPGKYALYHVTVTNSGTSNISQLFLEDNVGFAAYSATPSTGSCVVSPTLLCNLGALNAGPTTDTIDVVYQTPTSGSSCTAPGVTGSDCFNIDFQFNTSGNTFSDTKHRSHGDNLDTPVSTHLDGSADFAGGYVVFGGSSFSTQTGDVQSTTVNALGTGFPVTVQESSLTASPCSGDTGTPVGQVVTLHIKGGDTFSSDFLTTITIKTSALPDETVLSDISLCHQYDNQSTPPALLPVCATDAAPAGQSACFWPRWSGTVVEHGPEAHSDADDADNHLFLILDVFDFQNGGLHASY